MPIWKTIKYQGRRESEEKKCETCHTPLTRSRRESPLHEALWNFSIDDDEDEENPENPGLASKLTQVASETLRLHGFHEDKVQKH
jgi:hypothetical protein